MTDHTDPMFVLVPRVGSGFTLHSAELHGVSSVRLGCGRLALRRGLRLLDAIPEPPKGTHPCPKCQPVQALAAR